MNVKVGQRYRCVNPNYRCEVEVIAPSMEGAFNLRCVCGSDMKKPYAKPAVDAQPVFEMQKVRK